MEFIDEEIIKLEKELKALRIKKEKKLADTYIGYCFTFGDKRYYKVIEVHNNKGNFTFIVMVIDNNIFEIVRDFLIGVKINKDINEDSISLEDIKNACISPGLFKQQAKLCCEKIINSLE